MQNLGSKYRKQRGRASEQHGKQIKAQRAKQYLFAPDKSNSRRQTRTDCVSVVAPNF